MYFILVKMPVGIQKCFQGQWKTLYRFRVLNEGSYDKLDAYRRAFQYSCGDRVKAWVLNETEKNRHATEYEAFE